MGLLDRVVSGETLPALHTEETEHPFREDMGVLEGAPRFLNWVIRTWHTEKAALLVLDRGSETFIPAEITGFDVTTKRRLILDKSVVEDWLQGQNAFELNDPALFHSFFSAREAGRAGKLIGLGCRLDEELFALILILLDEDDQRSMKLTEIPMLEERETMAKLHKSLFPDESGKDGNIDILDSADLMRRFLTDGDGKVIIKLFLPPLISFASSLDALKDEHDCRGEILSLFPSFFNERVSLFLDHAMNLYIMQPDKLFPGTGLMKNQLLLGLGQLLGEKPEEVHLPMAVLENPATDRKGLEEFLAR